MPVKCITVECRKNTEIKYPVLMETGGGVIVLFTKKGFGTQLNRTDNYDVGHYSKSWPMHHFKTYVGDVTLQNE